LRSWFARFGRGRGALEALAAPAMRWRMLSATGAILAAGLAGLLLR
jgi:hypothetical protein